ncbi:prorelaxin-like [Orycteropus afer afer]|uniref:Prorelaxin-like n=1 Tax=Orycteropus afer afer TaxID=1230840 RepID=A0A8B7A990_ORYAF|nr:prorelaxin-like [Orycteropus afer afer]
MSRLLVFHLLGVCLLLHQLPTALCYKPTDVVRLCGRDLMRFWIRLCGQPHWGTFFSRSKPSLAALPPAENVLSSNKNTENLNKMLAFIPNFQEKGVAYEERQKIIQKRDSEVEDNRPSDVNYLGFDKHPRKKRMLTEPLSDKCCHQGCTIKELVNIC